MSGYKRATVSISQDEYDRLREAETKLKTLPDANQEARRAIEEYSLGLLQACQRDFHARENEYQAVLSGMNGQIRELESVTARQMREFEENTTLQVREYVGSLWQNYESLLDNQARQFNDTILAFHRQHQGQIADIIDQLALYQTQSDQRQLIAETWEEMAAGLFEYTTSSYACDFFMPGVFERYEDHYLQARNNYDLGLYEAAVASFQNLYNELGDARLQLEKQHREWNILFQAAFEAVNHLNSLIESSAYVQAVDLDGDPLDCLVDVNFWTGDGVERLADNLRAVGNQLFDENAPPTRDCLVEYLDHYLPQMVRDLQNLVLEARVRAINSQLRINMAELVVQALNEQGFTLSNAAYESNDVRLEYGAQLSNMEGSEVVVTVSPNGNNIGENQVQIQSLDAETKTEHELRSRWVEISRSLQGYGLDVGAYERLDQPGSTRGRKAPLPLKPRLQRQPLRQSK